MRARLTIEAGEGHPSACDLTSDAGVTVGRHRTNGLVIQDKHASATMRKSPARTATGSSAIPAPSTAPG